MGCPAFSSIIDVDICKGCSLGVDDGEGPNEALNIIVLIELIELIDLTLTTSDSEQIALRQRSNP